MRDVDLGRYRFDFDLTFAILFLNSNGRVYGRYGGRDAEGPESRISIRSLENALERALALHETEKELPPRQRPRNVVTAEAHPGAEILWKNQKRPDCYHCHMVYDIERAPARNAGRWSKREAFVFPAPGNVGITLEVDEGNRVEAIAPRSPADRAGLEPGDVLIRMEDQPILSEADVQWILHHARDTDTIDVVYRRNGEERSTRLRVRGNWKVGDISWRGSMWGIDPKPKIWAVAIDENQRRKLGIPDGRMAFEARWIPDGPMKRAGVRNNDIIVAIDGNRTDREWDQIQTSIRMERSVGDRMTVTVLRGNREVTLNVVLR